MNDSIQVNDNQVQQLLNSLNREQNNKILHTALKKGAQKLTDNTKQNLKNILGARASTPNRWNGKTMESGIRIGNDKDYCEVKVSIMGDFRMKFFEKGTQLRKTKKGYYRGRINRYNFFAQARDNDAVIVEEINKSINESLKRLDR